MGKSEKIFKVKNLKTGEIFIATTAHEKEIDGESFIQVWKENDPQKRVNWMRKDFFTKIKS